MDWRIVDADYVVGIAGNLRTVMITRQTDGAEWHVIENGNTVARSRARNGTEAKRAAEQWLRGRE